MAGEALFYGVGDIYALTTEAPDDIGEQVILPLELFEFELSTDSTELEAKSMRGGVLTTIASAVGETTYTLTLSTQYGNWSHLEFFLNQFASTDATATVPVLTSGTVPTGSPYEVVDADLTTATGVYVYVYDGQESGYRTIATAAPTAGEVQVDTAATKLVFHSSDAGKAFAYTKNITETNIKRLGGAKGDTYGTFSVIGKIYGPEWTIYLPSCNFKSTPTISLSGDVSTLTVECSANVPAGADLPYYLYKN